MFYCLSKLNRKNTKAVNEGVCVEMTLLCVHMCDIPMKNCKRLRFEKNSLFVGRII